MDETQHILPYRRPNRPTTHSEFGIVSICLSCAILIYVPIDANDWLPMSRHQHQIIWAGGAIASILSFSLGIAGTTQVKRKRLLAWVGAALSLLDLLAYELLPRL